MRGRRGAVVLALLLLLTGCWSRRELNDLAPVVGIGVDITDQGRYEVILAVVQAGKGGGTSDGGGRGESAITNVLLQGEGPTFTEALRAIELSAARRPALAHAQVVIIGEHAAKRGVSGIMDFMARNEKIRLSPRLLVLRDASLREALEQQIKLRSLPSIALREIMASHLTLTANLKDFLVARSTGYQAAVVPTLTFRSHGSREKEAAQPEPDVTGGAVFTGDRVATYLTGAEVRASTWLKGTARNGVMTVACPGHPDRQVSARVYRSTRKYKPHWNGRTLSYRIELTGSVFLSDVECPLDLSEPPVLDEIRKSMEKNLQERVVQLVHHLQDRRVDPFGFGEHVRAFLPAAWRQVGRERWPDTWATVPVEVVTHIKIAHPMLTTSGFTGRPPQ
jgi:spore germination protein KC